MSKKKPRKSSTLLRHLVNLDKDALFALVKDLYGLSVGNRDFIQAGI